MLLKQNTAFTRVFALPATGLSVSIKISKNGAALADPAAGASSLTELTRGLYKFALGTGDVDTLGSLAFGLVDVATGLTIYSANDMVDNVVVDLPGAAVSSVTGAVNSVTTRVTANTDQIAGNATAATNLANTSVAFETGTAQAGGNNTITLRAGASATNGLYKDQCVFILSGTGAGQTNRITAYNGTTKVATVEAVWAINPANDSVYFVLGRVG